jgi:hypothetical protein
VKLSTFLLTLILLFSHPVKAERVLSIAVGLSQPLGQFNHQISPDLPISPGFGAGFQFTAERTVFKNYAVLFSLKHSGFTFDGQSKASHLKSKLDTENYYVTAELF